MDINSPLSSSIDLLKKGKYKLARKTLSKLLKSNPVDPHALHLLGIALHHSGNSSEAIIKIKHAIKLLPNAHGFYTNLGNIYKDNGNLDEAIDCYKSAINLNANNAAAYHNLGDAYKESGKTKEAIETLEKALSINPDFAEGLNSLGLVYSQLNDFQSAVNYYQKALSIMSNSPEILYNLGSVYIKLKQYNLAIEHLQHALILRPDYSDAHNNLGSAYRSIDNFDKSVKAYQQAIKYQPDNLEALCNYGTALHAVKNYDEAVNTFKKVLKLEPNNSLANHLIAACNKTTTTQPPDGYVSNLFDEFAETFEQNLTEKLEYNTPTALKDNLISVAGNSYYAENTIDLGCGTGLSGLAFKDVTRALTGVDISNAMIDQAREKNIYDNLHVSGVNEFLITAEDNTYDLLISSDVFVYFGDLSDAFNIVSSKGTPGAYFLFSTETLEDSDKEYELRSTGRYAHSVEYIKQLALKYNFYIKKIRHINLRKNYDSWIEGDLYVMQLEK